MKLPKSILFLTLLWLLLFGLSFLAPRWMEATGDGFTRGLNRVAAFMLWQLGAFIVSITLFLFARSGLRQSAIRTWYFFLPLFCHLLMVGLLVFAILWARFSKPASSPTAYPVPTQTATSAPTAAPVIESSKPAEASLATAPEAPEPETFMGIYRSGFEMSHFYTMDGQGPWWLSAEGEAWEKLQSFYVERPGRGGGITVAMTVTGYLKDPETQLAGVGSIDQVLQVVTVESVRGLSMKEYQLIEQSVLSK